VAEGDGNTERHGANTISSFGKICTKHCSEIRLRWRKDMDTKMGRDKLETQMSHVSNG